MITEVFGDVASAIGPLRLTVQVAEYADIIDRGAPPVGVVVDPADRARLQPAAFWVGGYPYGGRLVVDLEGRKLASTLYRAGVGGRRVDDGAEDDALAAVREALIGHAEPVAVFVAGATRVVLSRAVETLEAEERRLIDELADVRARLKASRELAASLPADDAGRQDQRHDHADQEHREDGPGRARCDAREDAEAQDPSDEGHGGEE